jgi:FG-GAP repeat/Thrombospondin type 3 repeat/Bacterial TSP3 repeat
MSLISIPDSGIRSRSRPGIPGTLFACLMIISVPISAEPIQKLVTSFGGVAGGGYFGTSVSSDGQSLLIGASGHDANGPYAGAANVYVKDHQSQWVIQQKLLPADGSDGEHFGDSVAIDGDTAIVAATSTLSAYIFERDVQDIWIQKAKFTADIPAWPNAGVSVALHGDIALLGAAGPSGGSTFGGRTYVFKRDVQGIWSQEATLISSGSTINDTFGFSVAVNGNLAVVGAPREALVGAAYIFTRDAQGSWSESASLLSDDGSSFSDFGQTVSTDGNTVVVGAPDSAAGSVFVFSKQQEEGWTKTQQLFPGDGSQTDDFGYSVSLNGDQILVGAKGDTISTGAAYVFNKNVQGEWSESAKLVAVDGREYDGFGWSVQASNGLYLIGAPYDDTPLSNAGSAYVIDPNDYDGDDAVNATDNCLVDANTDQLDTDGDSAGDACDADDDGDGVPDSSDTFPLDPNETTDTDGDGIGNNADADDDGDAVPDVSDNCPVLANTEQVDTDGDGAGDLCDADDDNDTVPDESDNCPLIANADQANSDNDIAGNVCDVFPNDASETKDSDADGTGDNADPDDDNDGVPDGEDAFPFDPSESYDTDGDGVGNNSDSDDDNDGVPDVNDTFPLDASEWLDTDGDGVGDNADPDTDNDGMPDSFEIIYGLDPLDAGDSGIDADLDGYNNEPEFRAGTNPIDPADNPDTVTALHYKVLAGDGAISDWFGASVAVSGDTALIGAYSNDTANGQNSGAVYVYERSAQNIWTQSAVLYADDGSAGDVFGFDVAIDADSALIGAPGDDVNGSSSGSAYVFTRDAQGTWSQQEKIVPPGSTTYDNFGYSVSLKAYTALIGAYGDNTTSSSAGAAYVYIRDAQDNWSQEAKLLASDGDANDNLGISVSLSGTTALVGADDDEGVGNAAGSAYIFSRINGTWEEQAKFQASDNEAYDHFGVSVSLDGDVAAVGAWADDDNGSDSGSVYIFEKEPGGSWAEKAKLKPTDGAWSDNFGLELSLSEFRLSVGSRGAGAAYIFERDTLGIWDERAKIVASDGYGGSRFGAALSLQNDSLLVGAYLDNDNGPDAGAAYFFDLSDVDGDGVMLAIDNCRDLGNPDQADADTDNIGDLCDSDNDNDGVDDVDDPFPLDGTEWEDTDNDGIGNNADTDDDNDGFSDVAELAGGSDPLNEFSVLIPDGDLNNDGLVNAADLLLAQQMLAGTRTPTADQLLHRDVAPLVDGVPQPNGQFTAGDYVVIMRMVLSN